ncbi:MAG: NACHT domain-containing protein [Verrucomicrobia bacterium]|nr:NACHT domain-containing protein [Verrucomicrobiota bacterium]
MAKRKLPLNLQVWTGGDVPAKSGFKAAVTKYIERFTDNHGYIRVLGMRDRVAVKDLYTAVKVATPEDLAVYGDPGHLEEHFFHPRRRGFAKREVKSRKAIEVANETKLLNVLGQPGAGKSTFLRRVALEALPDGTASAYQHQCIPVFIELKRLDLSQKVTLEQLVGEEFEKCGFPAAFAQGALQSGRLLVLLDGLDEVPAKEDIQPTVLHVKEFVDRYPDNRYIVSCRHAFYRDKSWLPKFTDVVIEEFDDKQIEDVITKWFAAGSPPRPAMGRELWEQIRKPSQEATLDLARTPLLLTFICLTYQRSGSFISNRSYLYERALRILLEEWAVDKAAHRRIAEGFNAERETDFLSGLAGPSYAVNQPRFTRAELIKALTAFFAKMLDAPRNLDAGEILKAIEIQQGLIVARAHDFYTFSHYTLHEYLAARYFCESNAVSKIVIERLLDPRWREVFLLLAGMKPPGEALLESMVARAQVLLYQHPKLATLVRWIEDKVRANAQRNQAVAGKALLVYVILTLDFALANTFTGAFTRTREIALAHAFTRARDLARDLDRTRARDLASTLDLAVNRARALALSLDLAFALVLAREHIKILGETGVFQTEWIQTVAQRLKTLEAPDVPAAATLSERETITREFQKLFATAWELPEELSGLTEGEIKALEDYLYASHLIVQCKEASQNATAAGWHRVEKRLLATLDPAEAAAVDVLKDCWQRVYQPFHPALGSPAAPPA